MSRACKVTGYSRQQYYEIQRNFQTYGAERLIDRLPGRAPEPPQNPKGEPPTTNSKQASINHKTRAV